MERSEMPDEASKRNDAHEAEHDLRWIHQLHTQYRRGDKPGVGFPIRDWERFKEWWLGLPPDSRTVLLCDYMRDAGLI
ncbi:MAG: hypothetical protein Q7S29_03040 [Candidatus Peribacter sp.]|nr:hypothetical protein [Candidatus Peribacter sp.]